MHIYLFAFYNPYCALLQRTGESNPCQGPAAGTESKANQFSTGVRLKEGHANSPKWVGVSLPVLGESVGFSNVQLNCDICILNSILIRRNVIKLGLE